MKNGPLKAARRLAAPYAARYGLPVRYHRTVTPPITE